MSRSSEQDRAARRIYHLSHCIMRLRHRYGLNMDATDYDAFCEQFRKGDVQGARPDDKGHIEGWIRFKDTWVCMSYIPSSRLVGTIMPCPPPLVSEELAKKAAKSAAQPTVAPAWLKDERRINQQIGERAKKMAYTLYEQAMSSGKCPKWLAQHMLTGEGTPVKAKMQQKADQHVAQVQATRAGMDPEVKRADIAWFKNKMNDVRILLKAGRFLEAATLLDAAASLSQSFRPSAHSEEAERLIKIRMEAEGVWWARHFEAHGFPKTLEASGGSAPPSQNA